VTVPSALYNTYLFILCNDKRLIQYKYFVNVFFHSDSDSDWEPQVLSCPLYLCPLYTCLQWCSYATVHYCRHDCASGPKGHSMDVSLCSVSHEVPHHLHHLFSLPLHQKETAMGHGTGGKILCGGLPKGLPLFYF
jgi:hypothetical protein